MRVAFGPFELDLDGCELRRAGKPVALERRPTELLCVLAARPGELLTRHELAGRVWGATSGVDVDMGINTAIRQIRRALGDTGTSPRHVETVQGRGYRFVAALRAADIPAPDVPATLAVLPFDNLTGSAENDHVADGFTEEAIATLGQVAPDRLRVIGRRSVMALRHSALPPDEIGRLLGAGYLLESALRTQGDRLRITTRLLLADTQLPVWSATFDGQADRLLAFQEEVSRSVAQGVRDRLGAAPRPAPARRHTAREEAYSLYMHGLHCFNANQSGMNRQAIDYFERATAIDPSYALAWSGLADAHSASPVNSDVPVASIWRQARRAAEHAAASGPDLAEAAASVGFVRFWLDWDWPAALEDFRRAAALDPNYAFAWRMVGIASSHLRLHEAAREAMARAVALDPLFPMLRALSAVVALHAGRFEAAAGFAREAIRLDPRFWIGHWQLAQALEQLGETAGALAAVEQAARGCGNSSKPAMLLGFILAHDGQAAAARAQLAALHAAAATRFVPPYAPALIHAGLGEADAAFAALDAAVDVRDVNLAFLPVDPKWQILRGDARLDAILARCSFGGIDTA